MVEYVPDMHIVERSSRSVRISADWCSGSTPDSDSGDIGPIPVLAAKNKKKGGKNNEAINGEQEIPGRQKVVRGSSVLVLTSHVGLNPRLKSGYEREARVIK